jgi:putative membrane protein
VYRALGVGVPLDPAASAALLAAVAGGVLLGTLSGLCPGLHVNNLALLLAAAAPTLPGPPRLVGAAMLAAGVVHSFLDVLPALALGVPDAAMAASTLPGHRLVLAGRGREAIRLSALGSAGAVCAAFVLVLPLTAAMGRLLDTLNAHLPVLLTALGCWLVATERTDRARTGAVLSLVASGVLGLLFLDAEPASLLPGDTLAPLFAGLFGAPVLLAAMDGGGVPEQDDPEIRASKGRVTSTAFAGSFAGAVVGYVPGVSSAIAATAALAALPEGDADGDRGFLVATSGVNTSNTIFALVALAAFGTPRTGVTVALNDAGVPLNLPLLALALAGGAVAGLGLLLGVGDAYFRLVRSFDQRRLSFAVLCGLLGLSALFAGLLGPAVFCLATLVGLVPPKFGARRVHLMGVLCVPLALA